MSEPTRIYIHIDKIEFSGDNTHIVLMDCLRNLSKASDSQVAVNTSESTRSVNPIKPQPVPSKVKASGLYQKIVPTANPDRLLEVLHSLIDDKKSNYDKMLPLLAAIDLGYFIGSISCNDYCAEFGELPKSVFSRWIGRKYIIEANDLANMIGEIEAKMKA